MINEDLDADVPTTSRKELLKKIGVALTAASLGSLSSVAAAGAGTGQRRPVLPKSLPTALSAHEGKHYFIWFGLGKVSSAVVLPASDTAGQKRASALGTPARAFVSQGILQVNIGNAQSGISKNNVSQLVSFPGSMPEFNMPAISRGMQ